MSLEAALACLLVVAAPSPAPSPSPSSSPDPSAILERAIKANGGAERLARASVLKWRGRLVALHDGERVDLEGRWIVEPPERAVIVTWEKGKEAATRRALVIGPESFAEQGGARRPLPSDELTRERDRLDLYALMRLLPLRDPGVRLSATGPRTLRVERDGRPDAEMTFDGTGRLDRVRFSARDATSVPRVVREVTLAGGIGAGGIGWPWRINATEDGDSWDLEISEVAVGTAAELEREAARSP